MCETSCVQEPARPPQSPPLTRRLPETVARPSISKRDTSGALTPSTDVRNDPIERPPNVGSPPGFSYQQKGHASVALLSL